MGCHTWCAYKIDRPIEVARKLFIHEQENSIKLWKELVGNPQHPLRVNRGTHDWTEEFLENWIKVLERQLRMVKKGLCNVAVMNKQPDHTYYIEGKGFFKNCEDHGNQFRIGTYPPDQIFSKEECLQFIEKNKDKIRFFDKTYEWLDEFWNMYPDGYMHFG